MEVSYVGEAVPGEAPTYVLATDGVFLAYAETGTGLTHSVSVVYLRNPAAPALRLWSHLQDRAVTALCVGAGATGSSDPNPYDPEPQHQALLAVATSDAVVVWGLAAAYAAAAEGHQLPQPRGTRCRKCV
ncbi:hypothetical protein FOA52_007160 [Chlamydomonas sp. UWO 241]|nr:hypothetical protein FOA52_007160 [Chlamydomonas sp. UWO 241]